MATSGTPNTESVDYGLLEAQAASLLEEERDFVANAANFAALLYHELPAVNWAGFYFPDERGLLLGNHHDVTEACTAAFLILEHLNRQRVRRPVEAPRRRSSSEATSRPR